MAPNGALYNTRSSFDSLEYSSIAGRGPLGQPGSTPLDEAVKADLVPPTSAVFQGYQPFPILAVGSNPNKRKSSDPPGCYQTTKGDDLRYVLPCRLVCC